MDLLCRGLFFHHKRIGNPLLSPIVHKAKLPFDFLLIPQILRINGKAYLGTHTPKGGFMQGKIGALGIDQASHGHSIYRLQKDFKGSTLSIRNYCHNLLNRKMQGRDSFLNNSSG